MVVPFLVFVRNIHTAFQSGSTNFHSTNNAREHMSIFSLSSCRSGGKAELAPVAALAEVLTLMKRSKHGEAPAIGFDMKREEPQPQKQARQKRSPDAVPPSILS